MENNMTNILRRSSLTVTLVVILCLVGCSDSNLPSNQSTFNSLHKAAVKRYSDASNDIQHKEIWERRENEVCEKLPDGVMTDWIGVVERVGQNIMDKKIPQETASIKIRISETKSLLIFIKSAVYVQTFLGILDENAVAVRLGTTPNTTIVNGTPLYAQLASLKEGDKVRFRGQLIKDNVPGACFYDMSSYVDRKINRATYGARFTSITKFDKNEKSDSSPSIQSGNKDASNADQSGKKDVPNADACIDNKLNQVRKEIGPDTVISRAIITEIEESCGGKI